MLFRDGRPKNPIERNKIVFTDNSEAVADSIDTMATLLKKLPNYQAGWTEWSISDSFVYINFKKIGNIHNLINSGNKIHLLDSCEINTKRFLNLLLYFDRNFLIRVDFYNGEYSEYLYRFSTEISEYREDLDRMITTKRDSMKVPKNSYKIIDSTNSLILLANKNAKIWIK